MKKVFTIFFVVMLSFSLFAQAVQEEKSNRTVLFTDSCGRTVEIPIKITKVASSGAVSTMMMASVAPEYMCNVNSSISNDAKNYLDTRLQTLPVTGQLYGSKSTLNVEELIATGAQIIIDLGDYKKGIAEDLDNLQKQIGIPCIFIQADLANLASAYRMLGLVISSKQARCEDIAAFVDETINMAKKNSEKIKENEVVSVVYTGGKNGLFVHPLGSTQATVLDLVGAKNSAILSSFKSSGNGNEINMEQMYLFNPETIVFAPYSICEKVGEDELWSELTAIKTRSFFEVPSKPYNWLGNPMSINSIIGVWWLGNKLYPQYFDYDMKKICKKYFKLIWNCDISQAEIEEIL